jgi:hypothetical protein
VLHRSLMGLRALIGRSLAEVRLTRGVQNFQQFLLSGFIEELAPAATLEANSRGIRLTVIPVEDGLPGGTVHELFRPFEQRSADRTGLGLGLAFSRWGVEANNGRIYAHNLPERGCVFTVDLPRLPVPLLATV